ncbi:MAG TPA: FAD-dependent oxidoreductase [Acidimicrobiales bacterium]|nr:FAD-dependent oxidoreductase [Acidimicrobiales bacterium]
MAQRYQVIIVGGGPVGMALAVELGQRGLSVAVVERGREVGRLPKGQGLTHRSLEHFYFWNCLEEIRTIRLLPPGYPIGGINAYPNLVSDWWYPSGEARNKLGPYYFQRNDRLPQYLTEEVLRGRVEQLDNVTVLFERTAKGISQDAEGVQVQMTSSVWPYEDETLEGEYLVGCDGTGSIVLRELGIERRGVDFETRMALAVIHSPEFHEGTKRFGERTTFHVINPEMHGAWQFWGRVEAENTFFFHGPVKADATSDDKDYVLKVMQEAAGFEFDAEFQHLGFWNLRISVADRYRDRRVFIAGDAAHAHPPYGGQGLNNGLEDVTNLGWKLAAVLDGWGADGLLDSYDAERQAVFTEIGRDMIAQGIIDEDEWLKLHNAERDLADFEAAWKERSSESAAPQDFVQNYDGSPVVEGTPGATPGIHASHSLLARAGFHLAPQPLSSGENVFEALGTGFTLLAFGVEEAATKGIEEAAAAHKVPLTVVRDSYDGGREEYGRHLVLVRPDQFVSWVGDEPPADAEALVRKVAVGG